MAFNFNWTPLIASTSSPEFYSHAKELLTFALNRSAKSSVIVDSNVAVDHLYLGQSAPELEVLEIGDLAQDRFRGVFRMTYDGDALVTLKARVQVNPLCTYLRDTAALSAFTSPGPLPVASAPLTIPVQLTLSEFKLSGFVIVVFSKEKGITLVFRNDPLESMRVQSSFDSIPFIKNYLQKEIERQVRNLFQEELPLAVYKLSLRLLDPEDGGKQQGAVAAPVEMIELDLDPFHTPTSTDTISDDSCFSEKNMLHLRALRSSQKTLSPFTPSIRGAIYRATPPNSLDLRRPPADSEPTDRRLPLPHHGRRKKKHRVVNLRKGKEAASTTSETMSSSAGSSEYSATVAPEREGRPGKLSLVEERSLFNTLTPSNNGSEALPRQGGGSLSAPPRAGARVSEDRSQLAERYPSGVVEKALIMRFIAEIVKRAEERRAEMECEDSTVLGES